MACRHYYWIISCQNRSAGKAPNQIYRDNYLCFQHFVLRELSNSGKANGEAECESRLLSNSGKANGEAECESRLLSNSGKANGEAECESRLLSNSGKANGEAECESRLLSEHSLYTLKTHPPWPPCDWQRIVTGHLAVPG